MTEDFTVGVEEEFFLVDAETAALRPDADVVLAAAHRPEGALIDAELKRSQLETGSAVCVDLADLRDSVVGLRRSLAEAAAGVDARIAALATHPFARLADDGGVTPKAAYLELDSTYGLLSDEQTVCGCHVHVGVEDPELRIQVMNRVRAWVPLLVAVSANSPYWNGLDTGYASFRTQVFHRWPTAGIPEHFADRAEHDRTVDALVRAEAIDSPARLYWDVRPSARYPTLEFRAADVSMTVDETLMLAAIIRALVETCHQAAVAEQPHDPPRAELLRAALWRASRFGMTEQLLDPTTGELRPAPIVLGALLEEVRPVLDQRGELEQVVATLGFVIRQGTGAGRQRAVTDRTGQHDLAAVVQQAVTATTASVR